MDRIAIIGSAGSGKSTLAKKLGKILNIEVVHLDTLFWKPGWVESTMDELREAQENFIQKDRWIIDGNYSRTWDVRLNSADTIIFLDVPRIVCLYRVIKRYFKYRKTTRPDIGEGCTEKIDFEFLKFVWTYPKIRRPKALQVIEKYKAQKDAIILKNKRDVKNFIVKITPKAV